MPEVCAGWFILYTVILAGAYLFMIAVLRQVFKDASLFMNILIQVMHGTAWWYFLALLPEWDHSDTEHSKKESRPEEEQLL